MILTRWEFNADMYTLNYSFYVFLLPRLLFHANIVIIVKNNITIVTEWIIIKINYQSQDGKGYSLKGLCEKIVPAGPLCWSAWIQKVLTLKWPMSLFFFFFLMPQSCLPLQLFMSKISERTPEALAPWIHTTVIIKMHLKNSVVFLWLSGVTYKYKLSYPKYWFNG